MRQFRKNRGGHLKMHLYDLNKIKIWIKIMVINALPEARYSSFKETPSSIIWCTVMSTVPPPQSTTIYTVPESKTRYFIRWS